MPWLMKCFTQKRLALITYLAYILAGFLFLFWPSNAVRENTNWYLVAVWHVFLILGSGISIVGWWRGNVRVEVAGAPLTSTAVLAYIVILVFGHANGSATTGAKFGVACLLVGSLAGIIERVREVLVRAQIEADLDDREARDGSV